MKKPLYWGGLLCIFFSLAGCLQQPAEVYPHNSLMVPYRKAITQSLIEQGATVFQLGEIIDVALPADALFYPASANFKATPVPLLDATAALLKTYKIVDIHISAYTDNEPYPLLPNRKRLALSSLQAKVVSSYLWGSGINVRLALAKGYGGNRPVAWNGTVAGRALNRRVEVVFRFYPEE